MKIGKAIIQEQKIKRYNKSEFDATYKGRSIFVSDNHGFGLAEDADKKRFNIEVYDIMSGMYDVYTYEDFNNIEEAIIYALEGAMLV